MSVRGGPSRPAPHFVRFASYSRLRAGRSRGAVSTVNARTTRGTGGAVYSGGTGDPGGSRRTRGSADTLRRDRGARRRRVFAVILRYVAIAVGSVGRRDT